MTREEFHERGLGTRAVRLSTASVKVVCCRATVVFVVVLLLLLGDIIRSLTVLLRTCCIRAMKVMASPMALADFK